MIQLTSKGFTGSAETEVLRREFEQLHTFRLRQLIHPDLIKIIATRLEQTDWTVKVHQGIGAEAVPQDEIPVSILQFAANSSGFLDAIQQLTGCEGVRGFSGRIYRFATQDHFDSWHDDLLEDPALRMVGMSVNLSSVPYKGGVFRIRNARSADILRELPNTEPGDAIFFRISPALQHVVSPIEGVIPKTAYAGWFGARTFYPGIR